MFGGGNDTTTVKPTDHQDLPVDNALADAPANGLTPGDAPAQAYGPSSFGTSPETSAAAAELVAATAPPPAAITDDSASQPAVAAVAPADDLLTSTPDDLISIKQQALQQLSPLVGHLDQSPEEKFRTTMMMIQASDNADLVKDAFAAAQQIPDEKARAQALLDVVNEINYFTQHHEQQQQQ
ncbi:MAG TPA: hypothetical protein VGO07_07545 [Candidatus Saccharimonadales bacterium]|jgi:hypothetical protein|nr:hypothetical protein [Candidatus Saccharimonadales bacterium]